MVKSPRPKPLCDGDCFNCVFADCTNNYPSAINDLEMQTRKDGQKHKKIALAVNKD